MLPFCRPKSLTLPRVANLSIKINSNNSLANTSQAKDSRKGKRSDSYVLFLKNTFQKFRPDHWIFYFKPSTFTKEQRQSTGSNSDLVNEERKKPCLLQSSRLFGQKKDIKMKNWLCQTNSDYEKLSKLPDILPLDKYIKL